MKCCLNVFFALLLSLSAICVSPAQSPLPSVHFRHLDYRGGLSDPNIILLTGDSTGFLWIGTLNGLNRFDGTTCRTFQENTTDSLNLQGNMVMGILETGNSNLWIGTQRGLSLYNHTYGSFKRLVFPAVNNGSYYYAYPFHTDDRGRLWCNMAGGIYVYDGQTPHLISYDTNGRSVVGPGTGGKVRWLITNASNGGIFVHYMDDLKIVKTVAYFREAPAFQIEGVTIVSDSLAWIASDRGLISLNPHTGRYELHNFRVGVTCLYPYKNLLFVGTNGDGLKLFDPAQKKVVAHYMHQHNNPGSIAGNHITKLFVDRNENLFVSIVGKGIDYARIKQMTFTPVLDDGSAAASGINNTISAVYQARDGQIWCGTDASGIVVLDPSLKKVNARYLPAEGINRIIAFSEEELLIESKESNFFMYSFLTRKFRKVTMEPGFSELNHTVRDPRNGKLMIGTPQGLAYLEKKTANTLYVNFQKQLTEKLEWPNVSNVCFIANDELLVQTFYTNLYLMRRTGNSFHVIKELARTPYNINGSLRIGEKIYLGTTSGLYIYDPASGNLGEKPVFSAHCTDLAWDGSNRLWINSNNGLYGYRPDTGLVDHYNESDGLQQPVFHSGTLIRLADGRMMTGGNNGLHCFDPCKVNVHSAKVKTLITGININDEPYDEFNATTLRKLDLRHTSNTLTFHITPLDFDNAPQRKMTYQMVGYDNEPIATTGASDVRYARMPPGNYLFKVFTEGGAPPTLLEINIQTPFWKKSGFSYALVVGGIALAALVAYAFGHWVRNRQMERLRIMINSQEEERKRIAIDLHDDLGGRLSSLKLYIQATAKGMSEQYLETYRDTTRLLDETISELRNILFNLSPKTLDENGLEAAIRDLSWNIERITTVKIEINTDTQGVRLPRSIQYSVYRICQELINNTLKHSGATQIYISLVYREDGLVFLYEDDGKGFEYDFVKKGYGLTNIQTHAQAIFSDLIVDSSVGKGTAVTLTIPRNVVEMASRKQDASRI